MAPSLAWYVYMVMKQPGVQVFDLVVWFSASDVDVSSSAGLGQLGI